MTDLQAAIGRQQLKKLDAIVDRRRKIASLYKSAFESVDGIETPDEHSSVKSNWQSYCVRLSDNGPCLKLVMQYLLENGISTRRGIPCAHNEPAFQNEPWTKTVLKTDNNDFFKESVRAQSRCLLLPLHHNMQEQEILYIKDSLEKALLNIS